MVVGGRAPSRVEFTGNAGSVRVWFLSADNPDNIRGYGFQGLVVDEAAMIPADVWHYVLRSTIAQTLGWAVFVSTPKGCNWFFDMFTRGNYPAEPDYCSLRFPSRVSPFFPESEWDDARRSLPGDVFRQEYEAQFLEDSAGVFRGVDGCLVRGELTANCANYANGDGSRAEAQRRGGGRPGRSDKRDVTDRGDPIRATVVPHAGGRHELDGGEAAACWDVLTGEMKRFEYSVSPTGGISYSAPGGYHDDCVMALALANWGRWQMGQAGRMLPVPGSVVSGRRRGDGGGARRGSRGVRVLGRRERCLVGRGKAGNGRCGRAHPFPYQVRHGQD